MLADFRAKWVGTLVGAAYMHAITQPPLEKHHPLWKAAVDMEKDKFSRKTKCPLYRRHTTSTALQLAMDHAFTGSYAKRFRQADLVEMLGCSCGTPLHTPNHIIRECPLYFQPRVNRAIHSLDHTFTLRQLFSTVSYSHRLLSFLQDTKAASCPPDTGLPRFTPADLEQGIG